MLSFLPQASVEKMGKAVFSQCLLSGFSLLFPRSLLQEVLLEDFLRKAVVLVSCPFRKPCHLQQSLIKAQFWVAILNYATQAGD
jgi:hypothetical protein